MPEHDSDLIYLKLEDNSGTAHKGYLSILMNPSSIRSRQVKLHQLLSVIAQHLILTCYHSYHHWNSNYIHQSLSSSHQLIITRVFIQDTELRNFFQYHKFSIKYNIACIYTITPAFTIKTKVFSLKLDIILQLENISD